MAASKTEIAKQLLSMALGMGLGGFAGGGASLARLAAGASIPPAGGVGGQAAAFAAKQYPEEFSPGWSHDYSVINIPGDPNFNQHGKANAGVIDEAGRMQSLEEHNAAISKYVRQLPPNANPKMVRAALHRGLEEEKNLAAFWNESESRRPFSVSSSAVTGIRLTPDARVEVQWKGKPTWYTFKQYKDTHEASLAAQKLLQADSIGRAVYPVVSRPTKNPLLGSWNRANYDGAFA